tara:strand:+ start:446 stop:889 length:444 start_codon:yes stop_codon:yes gene_type:complete
MKLLREYIRKEIRRISEEGMKSFPIPPEIRVALERDLGLKPLVRYVSTLKASATVPPSYRVFFNNNQTIDLYLEEIGVRAEISHKSYWLHDIREANEAKKALNQILTGPIPVAGEEGKGDEGGDSGDSGDTSFDEPAEEPAEDEPEA